MTAPELSAYDRVLVAFSGGKDSLAAVLHLLALGVRPERIELHHHDVDAGRPFMDWPCTTAYVRAVGAAFGIRTYLSWREGGFERELGPRLLPVHRPAPDRHADAPGRSLASGARLAGGRCGRSSPVTR